MANHSDNEDLEAIKRSVDEIKSLLILLNQEPLQAAKKRLLPEDSVKKRVYELCDGSRATSDIAQTIQKTNDYVSSYLSIHRREGLIRTVEQGGKQVHEQVF